MIIRAGGENETGMFDLERDETTRVASPVGGTYANKAENMHAGKVRNSSTN